MKKCLVFLAVLSALMVNGCDNESTSGGNQTPVYADYDIGNLMQTAGSITPVTITPKTGKSPGTVTIYYNGSTTLPAQAGNYNVYFNVAAAPGWNAASGLYAGRLNIAQAMLTPITGVSISITAPVTDAIPVAAATVNTGNCTAGTVTWSPTDNSFKGGTVYTASVTLTAANGHTFTGLTDAKVNGQTAAISDNTGTSVKLSYTFPATDTRTVMGIAIALQPTKRVYHHNDTLDLAGLMLQAYYENGSENVSFTSFAAKNITASPAHGSTLSAAAHNGQPVTISYGGQTATTSALTVNRINPVIDDFTVSGTETFTYDGSPKVVTVTAKDDTTTGTITVKYNGGANVPVNAGIYTITFDVAADANYNEVSGFDAGTLTINPKTVTFTVDSIMAQPYTGSTITPAVTVRDGSTILTLNTDYTVACINNTNIGIATVTITGVGNYAGNNGSSTFTIKKAAGASVSAPTLNSKTNNSITINPVTTSNGQLVEYAIRTSNSAPSTGWLADTTFNSLSAGTNYYIFARSVGNDNYETGTASVSLLVEIPKDISFNVTFTGPTEKVISVTKTTTNNLSKSSGGTITLGLSENFTNYEWYVGGTKVGTGKDITLNAGNAAFVVGNNWITAVVYENAVPWSGEFAVVVIE
jgi:hypothetical protein